MSLVHLPALHTLSPSLMRREAHRRTAFRAVFPPLIALAIAAALLVLEVSALVRSSQAVEQADRVITQATATLKLLVDMETGQRGYLIGGEPAFLEPYRAANAEIDDALNTLERIVSSVEQKQQAQDLRQAYQNWITLAENEIQQYERAPQTYRATFNKGASKRGMDDLRRRIREIIGEEEARRQQLVQATQAATNRTFIGFALALPILGTLLTVNTRGALRRLADQYDEREQAERRVEQQAALKQRQFLRDIMRLLSEGRLTLCDIAEELPAPLPQPVGQPVTLTKSSLRKLRQAVVQAATEADLPSERMNDLVSGVGEAGMNAVVHGGGGEGHVFIDKQTGRVQVRITDKGRGMNDEVIHRATLERGFSSAGTLGHGFWLMFHTCDRVYLLTGPQGTTVVLEQEPHQPLPIWARG
jgi:CHASE3 domain sensor protein/anti-sigma regulatory factor (Ser/Thr protein kinase)